MQPNDLPRSKESSAAAQAAVLIASHRMSRDRAVEDDPVRILIRSDDEKAVELALLAMDVEYEPVESSERGRSFRTVLQTECRGEDVLITVTNSHRAAKPVPPDEWQLPEEALSGLSEKGLRRLLGVD